MNKEKIYTLELTKCSKRSHHGTRSTKGITLIALVVTIIVLLILAGITIVTLMSDSGVFEKAERAAEETRRARAEEMIGLVNLDAQAQKAINGGLTAEEYFEIAKDHGLISDSTIGGDNVKDKGEDEEGNKVYELTTEEGDVFEVTIDEEGNVETEYQGPADGLPPRITEVKTSKTTNSITVEVTVNRLDGGEISYYIKKESDEKYPDEPEETSKNTSHIFEGLEQNVVYNIRVVVENSKGSDEEEVNERTGELLSGTITQKGETVWSNGEATIELETTETGYTMQYQVNSTEGTWQEYTGPITGLHHNDKVFARLWDEINGSGETAITILDGINPTVNVTRGTTTTSSIQVSVSSSDNESGMPASPTYSYYIKPTSQGTYPTQASHTGTENSYTFSGLTQNTSYDVKVTVEDNAGNTGEGTSTGISTTEVGGAEEGLQEGNITLKQTTWSNNTANITLSTSTNFMIQYKVGSSGTWTPASYTSSAAGQDVQVTGLAHNTIVYARLMDDAGNTGSEASVTVTDGVKPTVTVTKGTTTTSSIQVSVSSSDNESGMPASPTYSYYIKPTSQGTYPTSPTYTTTDTSYTFSGLQQNTSYDVKVTVQDNAGNTGEGTSTGISTTGVGGAEEGLQEGNITLKETTWSNNRATITLSTSTNFMIQYKEGSSGTWTPASYTSSAAGQDATVTGLAHNTIVYARLMDDAGNTGSEASVTVTDGVKPTVTVTRGTTTTSSIQVSVNSSDNESGMPSSPTYSYYIKPTSQGTYPTQASHTGTENSYTFSGLTQNTSYDVKVTVQDNAGNTGEGTSTGISTTGVGGAEEGLEEGNITLKQTTWSNNTANITLSTSTNFMIQYKVGSSGTWTPASYTSSAAGQDVQVTGLAHNTIVYARLMDDAGNTGSEASVTIQDGIAPAAATIDLSSISTTTGTAISATVTHTDNESGVATANSKYIYSTTSGNLGTTNALWDAATSFSSNPEPLTLSASEPGTYFLHVLTVDNAGNRTEKTSEAVTVTVPIEIGSTVTYNPSGTYDWNNVYATSNQTGTTPLNSATGQSYNLSSWKVLSIDEATGEVELVPTSPTTGTVRLQGAQGYNNAVKLLNDACNSLYGNEAKGITARSINIEDIEGYMTETALAEAHSYVNTNSNTTYGNQVSSAYTSNKNYPVIYAQEKLSVINGTNKGNTGLGLSEQNRFIERSEGTSTTSSIGAITTATSIQPYQTYWYKDATFMSTAFKDYTKEDSTTGNYYNLLIPNGTSTTYWMASRCVITSSSGCNFRVGRVNSGSVSPYDLYYSNDSTHDYSRALFPVVTLSSDLIEWSATSGFSVN